MSRSLEEPGKYAVSIHGHSDPDKTPEPVDCVFLWHTPSCREAVKRAGWQGLRLHSTNSLERARKLVSGKESLVLLVEAAPQDPNWIDSVADAFEPGNALWIAVLMQFDGERWIQILERGAFDVVCAPFQSRDLSRTVMSAYAKARSLGANDAPTSSLAQSTPQ